MKTLIKLLTVIVCLSSIHVLRAQKEVKKNFAAKEKMNISLVSGNCVIQKSQSNQINVLLSYTYDDDCFEYKMNELGNNLSIAEKFSGNCQGESNWEISVPEDTKISFNSASGDLKIISSKKGLTANTASGDIELINIEGEIDLNTASGDITIESAKGELDVNTASGNLQITLLDAKSSITTASGNVSIKNSKKDVKVNTASGNIIIQEITGNFKAIAASGDVSLEKSSGKINVNTASGNIIAENASLSGVSEFTTASGNVSIKLVKSIENDLTVSTASGNVMLDFNNNSIKGHYELTARKDKGEIISEIKFDKEEVIQMDGKDYDKKSFTLNGDTPYVQLKTASGKLKLVK